MRGEYRKHQIKLHRITLTTDAVVDIDKLILMQHSYYPLGYQNDLVLYINLK